MARLGMAFALASVAGVPLGIFLATTISWSAPFIAIVLAGLLALTLFVRYAPSLPVKPSSKAPLQQLWAVLNERSHWPAYALSSTLTTASFLVIPFISVYYLINCGVSEINLSYVYIVGGLAMLLVAPHIGKAADRRGKQKVFQAIAVFSLLPILLVTHLEYLNPPPVWLCILSSGAFIVGTSGRYMPALALATGSAKPDMRGGFANINNALIHFVSSTTTILLGLLVSPAAKSAGGKIVNYHFAGYLSCAFVLLAIWVSKRIKEVA
jgi:predicted MFS family arabinose efflux permease